jgi:hypothetical protein
MIVRALNTPSGQSSAGVGKKSFDSLKCCCDNDMHYGDAVEINCRFLRPRPGQSADAPGGGLPSEMAAKPGDNCIQPPGLKAAGG